VIEIRRILCPIDYSDCSRRALAYATAIARWYHATVTVLHVYALATPSPLRTSSSAEPPRGVAPRRAEESAAPREQAPGRLATFAESTDAREAKAELLLMHVIEGIPDAEPWRQPDLTLVRYLGMAETEARSRFQQVVPQEVRQEHKVEELLASGKAYREILRVARDCSVDLIMLGVHGRNPVDLLVFGSTAQHVVRAASCPVLTLRG
jgi:nucleotide-binding universal stress UspA family protein